jgi:hypothetical protein
VAQMLAQRFGEGLAQLVQALVQALVL